jgi:hypothetical protein
MFRHPKANELVRNLPNNLEHMLTQIKINDATSQLRAGLAQAV